MRNAPVVAYGTPSFWPYIAGERFYHNATVWPFVTAYWTWAAAEGGNTAAVQAGLDDATRSTALFLTNKENTVAATGHYEGTALNSDRQLWSVAGSLAATYRLLFGIRLEPGQMVFRPMVPPSYAGERTLRGMRYRGATLDITVRGYGDSVASAQLDGAPIARAEVAASLVGAHRIDMTMNGHWPSSLTHVVENRFAPGTPRLALHGRKLRWQKVQGATRYVVYRDGQPLARTTRTELGIGARDGLDEYQVLAVNVVGDESFLSAPVRVVPYGTEQLVKPAGDSLERESAGFTGDGYLRLTRERNVRVTVPVTVDRAATYAIDLRYANGNGPVNTEDKVAVRTLLVDGDTAGVVVLPQRGVNRWSEWGWSNVVHVPLTPGAHTVAIVYTPFDENMNRHENTALLDVIRITPVAADAPERKR